jgi:hypothetical protein
MSAMLQMEVPHLNVLSKMDLLPPHLRENLESCVMPPIVLEYAIDPGFSSRRPSPMFCFPSLASYTDPDPDFILSELNERTTPKYQRLNAALAALISDFSLVRFVTLSRVRHPRG